MELWKKSAGTAAPKCSHDSHGPSLNTLENKQMLTSNPDLRGLSAAQLQHLEAQDANPVTSLVSEESQPTSPATNIKPSTDFDNVVLEPTKRRRVL